MTLGNMWGNLAVGRDRSKDRVVQVEVEGMKNCRKEFLGRICCGEGFFARMRYLGV